MLYAKSVKELKRAILEIINDKTNTYTHQIYEIDTIENEVLFVANKITELLKNNISIESYEKLIDQYKELIYKICDD